MRVVIIGAGVLGTSIAFRLAALGSRTILVEEDRPGAGTTGASFAWVNARRKQPRAYHDLNVAGMAAHAALRTELGTAPWWHRAGAMAWTVAAEDLARLQRWGYAVEEITREAALAREPGLDHAAIGDGPFALFPDEAWVDAVVYAGVMLQHAESHGAEFRRGRVADLLVEAGKLEGVILADGSTIRADHVVNCAGTRVNDAVRDPALHLPLRPTRGLLATTPPVAAGLSCVLHAPGLNVRPDGGGRLLLQDESMDPQLEDPNAAAGIAATLMDRARALFPAIGNAAVEAVRVGTRPIPADGLTAIGPVPGLAGYFVAVTHSGVTLAAHLGHVMAGIVDTGDVPAALAPFAAARLYRA